MHTFHMRKVVVALVALIASVVVLGLYFSVGWNRMASECGSPSGFQSQIPPDTDTAAVTYSWRWSKGFTCTYTTNATRSSFWFEGLRLARSVGQCCSLIASRGAPLAKPTNS